MKAFYIFTFIPRPYFFQTISLNYNDEAKVQLAPSHTFPIPNVCACTVLFLFPFRERPLNGACPGQSLSGHRSNQGHAVSSSSAITQIGSYSTLGALHLPDNYNLQSLAKNTLSTSLLYRLIKKKKQKCCI